MSKGIFIIKHSFLVCIFHCVCVTRRIKGLNLPAVLNWFLRVQMSYDIVLIWQVICTLQSAVGYKCTGIFFLIIVDTDLGSNINCV